MVGSKKEVMSVYGPKESQGIFEAQCCLIVFLAMTFEVLIESELI